MNHTNTSSWIRSALSGLAIAIVGLPALAESFAHDRALLSTADVGDRAAWLAKEATCDDFMAALSTADSKYASVGDTLTVILGLTFLEGYAAGSGLDKTTAMKAVFTRCLDMPGLLLSRIGKLPN